MVVTEEARKNTQPRKKSFLPESEIEKCTLTTGHLQVGDLPEDTTIPTRKEEEKWMAEDHHRGTWIVISLMSNTTDRRHTEDLPTLPEVIIHQEADPEKATKEAVHLTEVFVAADQEEP